MVSYGYATNTRVKFIIVTENTTLQSRDSDIKLVSHSMLVPRRSLKGEPQPASLVPRLSLKGEPQPASLVPRLSLKGEPQPASLVPRHSLKGEPQPASLVPRRSLHSLLAWCSTSPSHMQTNTHTLQLFKSLHVAYTDMFCNPFYIPGMKIKSK